MWTPGLGERDLGLPEIVDIAVDLTGTIPQK